MERRRSTRLSWNRRHGVPRRVTQSLRGVLGFLRGALNPIQSRLQLLEPRLIGIGGEPLRRDSERAAEIAIGLQTTRLGKAPRDELLAALVRELRGETARRNMPRIELKDFLKGALGDRGIRFHRFPRMLEQGVDEHGPNHGIAGI